MKNLIPVECNNCIPQAHWGNNRTLVYLCTCNSKTEFTSDKKQEVTACKCECHLTICKEPLTFCMKCSGQIHSNEIKAIEEKSTSIKNIKVVGKRCEAVGYKVPCEGEICWGHIITRSYKPLKKSSQNRIWLCKSHEKYFNTVGKQEWDVFVMARYPERWNYILKKYKKEEISFA